MNIYLDIETIPSQSPEVHARIAESVTPPGNISKPETIAAWEADKKPALVKEAIAKTALDGSVGHVCCIGVAINDRPPASYSVHDINKEGEIIRYAMDEIRTEMRDPPIIIGHNVIDFDIRFLWQRAIVLGVSMPNWFPRDPKPWSGEVFDTMTAFAGSRGKIGMDRLCLALGLEGKGDIDGSMIGEMWGAGKHKEIAKYCRDDVNRTRAIHRRMQLAYGEVS